MDQKIQLLHPAGKHAFRIDKEKYDIMKTSIINCLTTRGNATYTEILESIINDFERDKISFDGSLEWYLESVKLDLEARNEIKRVNEKGPVKYGIT